jgi:hypothetical protein
MTATPPAKVAPTTIEKPKSGSDAVMKKKKKFLILLAVLGAAVVGAVLYFTVFKSKSEYDIRGKWRFTHHDPTSGSFSADLLFSGKIKSGTVLMIEDGLEYEWGNYSVNEKNVVFSYSQYSGSFSDKNHMSGTSIYNSSRWEAVRK